MTPELKTLCDSIPALIGPRITDQFPPGFVGVYEADDEGPIPGEIFCTTGRHDEPDALTRAKVITIAVNNFEALSDLVSRLAAYRCECDGFARAMGVSVGRCDACHAKTILAAIEAAATAARENKP